MHNAKLTQISANKRKREPVICEICNQVVPQSALKMHKLVMYQVATPLKQAKQPKHISLEEYKRLTALKAELAVMRSKVKATPLGAQSKGERIAPHENPLDPVAMPDYRC